MYIEKSLQSFRSGFSSAKTLSTLSAFNGIVSWLVYQVFFVTPEYIAAPSARKLAGIKIPRGQKAKEVVLQFLLDNEADFEIEYTKQGNPKPGSYDRADALVVAKAGIYSLSEQKKLNIVSDALGNFYRSGEEYIFRCGFCNHHKKKLSVNIEKNKFKCWICESSGNDVRRLVRRFGNRDLLQRWDVLTDRVDLNDFDNLFEEEVTTPEQTLKLPQEFISLVNKGLPYSSIAPKNYLRARGITKGDIIRWKMGYCPDGEYGGRIVVPSFNKDGYVNYFVGRSYGNAFPKYKNPPCQRTSSLIT